MFRQMYCKKQQMTEEQCEQILKEASSGVLALQGDDGYPYAVPVSFVYRDRTITFHGARIGHKMDSIHRDSHASFCVIARDDVIPEKYTTHYESVIVFGRVREVTDDAEKRSLVADLSMKYRPGEEFRPEVEREIEREWPALAVFELAVEHMTGKHAR